MFELQFLLRVGPQFERLRVQNLHVALQAQPQQIPIDGQRVHTAQVLRWIGTQIVEQRLMSDGPIFCRDPEQSLRRPDPDPSSLHEHRSRRLAQRDLCHDLTGMRVDGHSPRMARVDEAIVVCDAQHVVMRHQQRDSCRHVGPWNGLDRRLRLPRPGHAHSDLVFGGRPIGILQRFCQSRLIRAAAGILNRQSQTGVCQRYVLAVKAAGILPQ